jgi:molybdenum cofactor guanylyltransferase
VLVLAGGRSRRFGRDKLRLDWGGRTLRDHVIGRMLEMSDDVILLAAHDDRPADDELAIGVRVVADDQPWPGPLVAAAAGLAAARHELVLLTAADMPAVPLGVIRLMLAEGARPERTVVGLLVDAELQPLPVCMRRTAALAYATQLINAGERRLGALRYVPGAYGLAEERWRALDPHANSLLDIDTERDLARVLGELSAADGSPPASSVALRLVQRHEDRGQRDE